MIPAIPMVEIWRGPFLESCHVGHACVCDDTGQIVEAWGDPELVMLPRSSSKMLQALPLIESGAATAHGLTSEHLALACASHSAEELHVDRVAAWLKQLELPEAALRCGAHLPLGDAARESFLRADGTACQLHNNCSGKHAGFLTLEQHIGGGEDYVDPHHPVQLAVLEAFEDMTGVASPGFGVDGCSAPNFATTLHGLAKAMARFASAEATNARSRAARDLTCAMMAHPELVAGEGRACTELMRAAGGRAALKTGAEAVFVAILPEQKLGMAVKISDGSTRAAEAAITGLLVKYGVLERNTPAAQKFMTGPIRNARGLITGEMRLSADFIPL